jgi:hypothetical protein
VNPDWLLVGAIGGIVLSGTFALLWLADDLAAFREGHWPDATGDDSDILPWGDVIRDPRADVPSTFHHGSGDKL